MEHIPERWLTEYNTRNTSVQVNATKRMLIRELGEAEHEIAELKAQLAVLSTLAKALGGAE